MELPWLRAEGWVEILTTRIVPGNAFPLRVRVQHGTGGLNRDSDILVDQMLAWDNSLFRRELGVLPEGLQDEVKVALREFLDLAQGFSPAV